MPFLIILMSVLVIIITVLVILMSFLVILAPILVKIMSDYACVNVVFLIGMIFVLGKLGCSL